VTAGDYTVSADDELVEAIVAGTVARWAARVRADPASTEEQRRLADMAAATCARIRRRTGREADRLVSLLAGAGIAATATSSDQRHAVTIDVRPTDAPAALAICESAGFRRVRAWTGGAERSFWRVADEVLLTRTATDTTTVVRLRWRRSASTLRRRLFRPTPADWDAVELPTSASWGYAVIRPLRLALERSGLRRRDHATLEPMLVTPGELLEPLLDVGCVGPDDVLVDVGCGDGRVVVGAAVSRRCRAIGVELSAAAAADAAQLARHRGVSERVEIINADVREVALDEVTVAILFVPMVLAGGLVGNLLARLPSGARVVLHEQGAPSAALPAPEASFAIVADEAMTVAHRWIVGRRRTGSPSA